MADLLDVELGAEVVLVAPASDGSLGNDLYRVSGIFATGMVGLDGSLAILPIMPPPEPDHGDGGEITEGQGGGSDQRASPITP